MRRGNTTRALIYWRYGGQMSHDGRAGPARAPTARKSDLQRCSGSATTPESWMDHASNSNRSIELPKHTVFIATAPTTDTTLGNTQQMVQTHGQRQPPGDGRDGSTQASSAAAEEASHGIGGGPPSRPQQHHTPQDRSVNTTHATQDHCVLCQKDVVT